jgi:hypothetical protein
VQVRLTEDSITGTDGGPTVTLVKAGTVHRRYTLQ